MSKLLGKIKQNKASSANKGISSYQGRKAFVISSGTTFNELVGSGSTSFSYDDKKFTLDLCSAVYTDISLNRDRALELCGLSADSFATKVLETITMIDEVAKDDIAKALSLSRQYFGKKNPLLNILHILNEFKKPIVDLALKDAFKESDYNYVKNIGLLKRNLTLGCGTKREEFQFRYNIDTRDLKVVGERILFLCADCLEENFVSQSESDGPLKSITCKCGGEVHPSRGLMGWNGIDGMVFKFGLKQIHSNRNGKITKRETGEYIRKQVAALSKSERIYFSGLMLRHSDSMRKNECLCAQCLLEG